MTAVEALTLSPHAYDVLEDVVANALPDAQVWSRYVGPGMTVEPCLGLVCHNTSELLSFVLQVRRVADELERDPDDPEAGAAADELHAFLGALEDHRISTWQGSLGVNTIFYWRSVRVAR